MKKIILCLFPLIMYFYSIDGTAQENSNFGIIKSKSSKEFIFEFSSNFDQSYLLEGTLALEGQLVNVEMDISNGVVMKEAKISENGNSLSFISKSGDNISFDIIEHNEEFTKIKFTSGNSNEEFMLNGKHTFHGLDQFINKKPSDFPLEIGVPTIAPLIWLAAVAVTGAYCTYKSHLASSSCVSAYNICVTNNKKCSYKFESSTCGGTCTIDPR